MKTTELIADETSAAQTYLCVYGHFYQPPREDPATQLIPREPAAAPYANFNEKITAECYAANARAGNFERISFNMGPTLATWLERYHPDVHAQIVAADHHHRVRTGQGNALAQAYNHTILPLASQRDRRIQIAWGLADFQHRFGRPATGMWLPETAADTATLATLADMGVQYTVLAPWQADARDQKGQRCAPDTSEPYSAVLPGNRELTVFLYNSAISGDVSFNGDVTSDATRFTASHLPARIQHEKQQNGEPQILLIATDGEVYGHHKPFRDMFLTHLLSVDARNYGFTPITLGHYLSLYPPAHSIKIQDRTSWSCHHGVARWSTGCSCTEGDSSWKAPLRAALDELAGHLDNLTDQALAPLVTNPSAAIEDYIAVRLGAVTEQDYLKRHCGTCHLNDTQVAQLWDILEVQVPRQAMYTSCAFFFEDLDRIEPRIVIAQARYALQLMEDALGTRIIEPLVAAFLSSLAQAKSQRSGCTGADLYQEIAERIVVAA